MLYNNKLKMKTIKINFVDFWPGFNPTDNYFYNLLITDFDVIICKNPDYLFYSVFGNSYLSFDCIKIFYSGENIGPDFNQCDYSLCYDYLQDSRHYRLPLYILYGGYNDLTTKNINENLFNRKFCNFIYSNFNCPTRNNFFEKLSKYKKVDSGGKVFNNTGYLVGDKLKFQSEYKFSIAFENELFRLVRNGYTTEKILQPMQANSIPIYWGNPLIDYEFNQKSFINLHKFTSENDAIDYIIHLDKSEDDYMKMMCEPWLSDNLLLENLKEDNIKKFIFSIFYNNLK
jgi:hypothetical protein